MQNQSKSAPARCQYDAGEIFKGSRSGAIIEGYDKPSPAVPVLDPAYSFMGWQADLIVWWMKMSATPVYIYGPAGCGKTSCLKQIAARVNYPVYEVTGYDSMQPVDLEGCQSLAVDPVASATITQWLYGPLAKAMREGGLFIFNEMDMASPGSLVALNTVLDGSPLVLEQTGEIIRPAPGFMFAATGNSNGSGDSSGAYTGVMRQNFALQDRFICLEAGYMPKEAEIRLVARAAQALPAEVHGHMVEFANITRTPPEEYQQYADMLLPMSTRALIRWAQLAEVYAPAAAHGVNVLAKSLSLAFSNARDKGQQAAYAEILQRITGNG